MRHFDYWVRLARLSLETFVRTGKVLDTLLDGLPGEMTDRSPHTSGVGLPVGGRGQGRFELRLYGKMLIVFNNVADA